MSFLNSGARARRSFINGAVTTALAIGMASTGLSCRAREQAAGGAIAPPRGAPPAAATPNAGGALPEPNRGIAVGDTPPDFALTDQTGRTVRLSELRGEPVALTFVYTRCPDATACPMTMARFAKLNAEIAGRKLGRLLAITVDPENDTPAVLADYATRIGADPARWKFLTGDAKALARVAETFGVLYYPEHGKIVHTQAVAVLDPEGRLSAITYGADWEPEQILNDLEKARKP